MQRKYNEQQKKILQGVDLVTDLVATRRQLDVYEEAANGANHDNRDVGGIAESSSWLSYALALPEAAYKLGQDIASWGLGIPQQINKLKEQEQAINFELDDLAEKSAIKIDPLVATYNAMHSLAINPALKLGSLLFKLKKENPAMEGLDNAIKAYQDFERLFALFQYTAAIQDEKDFFPVYDEMDEALNFVVAISKTLPGVTENLLNPINEMLKKQKSELEDYRDKNNKATIGPLIMIKIFLRPALNALANYDLSGMHEIKPEQLKALGNLFAQIKNLEDRFASRATVSFFSTSVPTIDKEFVREHQKLLADLQDKKFQDALDQVFHNKDFQEIALSIKSLISLPANLQSELNKANTEFSKAYINFVLDKNPNSHKELNQTLQQLSEAFDKAAKPKQRKIFQVLLENFAAGLESKHHKKLGL